MMQVDWLVLGWGTLAGAIAAAVFFVGLALSVRFALRATRPTPVLLASGVARIGLLLAFGWWVATLGLWSFIGFAVAFLITRTVILAFVRKPPAQEASRWS